MSVVEVLLVGVLPGGKTGDETYDWGRHVFTKGLMYQAEELNVGSHGGVFRERLGES